VARAFCGAKSRNKRARQILLPNGRNEPLGIRHSSVEKVG
jgi:hypothetical protein